MDGGEVDATTQAVGDLCCKRGTRKGHQRRRKEISVETERRGFGVDRKLHVDDPITEKTRGGGTSQVTKTSCWSRYREVESHGTHQVPGRRTRSEPSKNLYVSESEVDTGYLVSFEGSTKWTCNVKLFVTYHTSNSCLRTKANPSVETGPHHHKRSRFKSSGTFLCPRCRSV